MTVITTAKAFWSAAYFQRRAPNPDDQLVGKILTSVSQRSTGLVRERAEALLRERPHGTDTDPSRDGSEQ